MSHYTIEFKTTVAKAASEAKTYAEVAKQYGVPVKSVKEWLTAYTKYGALAFVEGGPQKFEERRVRALERELADLKEENAILKKAAAYFSRGDR